VSLAFIACLEISHFPPARGSQSFGQFFMMKRITRKRRFLP
jgi:hypothetical protein